MKKIEAIIRPEKLDDVLQAVDEAGYTGVMITEIKGHGKQKGIIQQWRGGQYRVSLLPKIKLEIVCHDKDVAKIKSAISRSAKTGSIGDGKIFISDIIDVLKIRTDESGDDAI
ncbi:MAG TPA: P-II family nitrogen regulator [Spirochaetota bacterium]